MGGLSTLFVPQRVAVVGASDKPGTVGHAVTGNLLAAFDGETVTVNPNRTAVLGLGRYDSPADIDNIDVAVVVVPAAVAVDIVRDAAEVDIKDVVAITAGFSEAGGEGSVREATLRDSTTECDLNVVGPNSLGAMCTGVGINARLALEWRRRATSRL